MSDRAASSNGRSFVREGVLTVAISVVTLVVGLLTGVMVARNLGTHGRGALAAVLTAPQVMGWLLAMGAGKAAAYFVSRDPAIGGRLLASWLLILAPVALAAIIIGEISLPWLLSAQSQETLQLARLFMPTIVLVLLSDLVLGIVLGDQDFLFFNLVSLAHPSGVATAYVFFWAAGIFTVESAVAAHASMSALVLVAAAIRIMRRHPLGRPDLRVARRSVWYALRTHGEVISGVVTQRLDLLIIPAFLSASNVGLYALATNISWLLVSVSGTLATILMPAAARRGAAGRGLVVRTLQATFLAGTVVALTLFLLADALIRIVYGPAFAESALPLRILLPGAVLYACACVLVNGLYALNRPFTATIAQLVGMTVTIVGLVCFLGSGGIIAAAVVSTIAYTLVFLLAAILYQRAASLGWRQLIPRMSETKAALWRGLALMRLVSLPRRGVAAPRPEAVTEP